MTLETNSNIKWAHQPVSAVSVLHQRRSRRWSSPCKAVPSVTPCRVRVSGGDGGKGKEQSSAVLRVVFSRLFGPLLQAFFLIPFLRWFKYECRGLCMRAEGSKALPWCGREGTAVVAGGQRAVLVLPRDCSSILVPIRAEHMQAWGRFTLVISFLKISLTVLCIQRDFSFRCLGVLLLIKTSFFFFLKHRTGD